MKLSSFALFGGGFQDVSNFSMFTSPDIMEDDLVDTRIYFLQIDGSKEVPTHP